MLKAKFVDKVMHIIPLSYVSQSEIVQVIFYYPNTYTDGLQDMQLLSTSAVLWYILRRPLKSVGKEKLNEDENV